MEVITTVFPSRCPRSGLVALSTAFVMLCAIRQPTIAAEPASAPASQPAEEQVKPSPAPAKPYLSKAWGARPESEPPSYVKTLDKLGLPGLEDLNWLEFGLQHRTRFERRDDDYRRPRLDSDNQFLLRSRTYLGIREIIDPLRFGLEFQDSRQFHSRYPDNGRDIDEAEIVQMFLELYFEDALGKGYPLRFQFGRMSFDYVDRRLVGRQRWGNTTNAYDGFRLQLGKPTADWQLDFLAVQPVERFMRQFNHGDDERWLFGLVGAWRRWHRYITLEPYWFILDENRKLPTSADRTIHTMGLHVFGPIGDTGFDYDLNNTFQFGDDGERRHCAYAMYGEVGYTFAHEWKPRLSFSTYYGSGDRNPDDGASQRFDRMFGPGHPWSMTDCFHWQNVICPKVRLEFAPLDKLRLDTAYGGYWLASDSDSWVIPGRRDRTGQSGSFVGHEIDVRMRYKIDPRIELEVGYSHFMPGAFVRNTGPADDSDFFYVATTFNLFK